MSPALAHGRACSDCGCAASCARSSRTPEHRDVGDGREPDLISVGRTDLLRETGAGLRLARHEIIVDESVLRTQNLAVFL
jgi:hypothetical protein